MMGLLKLRPSQILGRSLFIVALVSNDLYFGTADTKN